MEDDPNSDNYYQNVVPLKEKVPKHPVCDREDVVAKMKADRNSYVPPTSEEEKRIDEIRALIRKKLKTKLHQVTPRFL